MFILIYGYSLTGKSVEKYCIRKNYKYCIHDDNLNLLSHLEKNKIFDGNFDNITKIIISPGILPAKVEEIKTKNLNIMSDIEFFNEEILLQNKKTSLIGITGTNGKSTTTSLIAHILNSKFKAISVGNIGLPIFDFIDEEIDFFVIELSSAQLLYSKNLNLNDGIIVSLQEDHIDFHGSLENYYNAKKKIFSLSKNQYLNYEYKNLIEDFNNLNYFSGNEILKNGISVVENKIYKNANLIGNFEENINLSGDHNKINLAGAISICLKYLSINDILSTIQTFKALEHRNEFVKKINNISFFNDSKCTNIFNLICSLKTHKEKNIFLIAGGKKKDLTFKDISNQDLKDIRKVFLIGESQEKFFDELKEKNITCSKENNLEQAVKNAFIQAKNERNEIIILLSPICASFDQFKNFNKRGERFKELVNQLS